ncbi:MAG: bifunctional glutamate N-acetyltransferase/amino-acid acetyltransferase ArgJ [Deltaproteobacteria bacterium]|nr:bifunctional glutamate N-acetyltransferase/amino-acid acetyltransferase ArgJ [Deltaproteobacteria bacterium]
MEVPGFLGSGIYAGIKKKRKKDLGLIFSEVPARVAAVFTTNIVKAAPVIIAMERVKGGFCRAIIVNSGNANACTAKRGIKDAELTTKIVASKLKIEESLVIPASTGVIGEFLPVKKIEKAVPNLISGLRHDGLVDTAEAMMTTDRFPKYASSRSEIDGKLGTICAIGKGAGMIAPQMATMLCFILTDISLTRRAMIKSLKSSVERSFNKIIVDGDTSTNDTVMMLSNGVLQNKAIWEGDKSYKRFERALTELNTEIAEMIVRDGEGATKVVKIIIKGTRTENDANLIARTLGSSLLVKTAFYGEDPNWGRLIAAAGRAGVKFDPQKVDLYFGDYKVVRNGVAVMNGNKFEHIIRQPDFTVTIDIKNGKSSSFVIASDITMEYLKLNAHYRT